MAVDVVQPGRSESQERRPFLSNAGRLTLKLANLRDPSGWRFQMFWYHDLRPGLLRILSRRFHGRVLDQLPETACSTALIRETLPDVL